MFPDKTDPSDLLIVHGNMSLKSLARFSCICFKFSWAGGR